MDRQRSTTETEQDFTQITIEHTYYNILLKRSPQKIKIFGQGIQK